MKTPSLALIPSGYKSEKVYSVLPSNGDGDFTFSRDSNATRVNKDGLIEDSLELVSEVLSDFDFDFTNWSTVGGASSVSSDEFTTTSTGGVRKTGLLTVGKKYKVIVSGTTTSTDTRINNYAGSTIYNSWTSTGSFIFEFTFTAVGDDGLYFRHSSSGTTEVTNFSVKEVLLDIPRLDYTDGSCPSLLLENQSTNLLTYSEDFSGWQNIWSTDSFGSISPSGDANATTVTDDGNGGGASGNIRIQKNGVPVSASTKYTFSCFLKPNPNNIIEFRTSNDNIVVGGNWDLSTQVFTPYGSETGSVELISNNWYRASITWTTGTDTSIALRVGFPNVLRDGSNSFDIWGAQLEESSITSSYIPTDTAIATRLMDQASNDFSSQPTVANTNTVVLKFIPMGFDTDFNDLLRFSDGTNELRIEGQQTNNYDVVGSGLTSSGMIDGILQLDAGSINTISFSYRKTSLRFSHNGSTIATTTPTGNLPTITKILHTTGGLSPIKILKLEVYNDFKTQEELNSLTNSN